MRIIFLAALLIGFALVSCNNSKEKEDIQEIESQTANPDTEKGKPTSTEAANFDINKIPISDFAIADIPFFNLPEGYAYSSKYNRDYESIRFWTGNDFVIPEGSLFYGRIATV